MRKSPRQREVPSRTLLLTAMITLRTAFASRRRVLLSVFTLFLGVVRGLAQSDLILWESPPEDFLGQGKTYRTTDPFEIAFSGGESGIVVDALDFRFEFQPPANQVFKEGVYTNALRSGANPDLPGFSIVGRGRG